MKLFAYGWIAFCIKLVLTQRCRQVCDDNDVNFNDGQKGMKGNVGNPGKAGSPGIKGSKGDEGMIGERGPPGQSCALGSFGTDIIKEVNELKEFIGPSACHMSQVNGEQLLRSGEKVYCEDGWTVFQRRFDGSVDFHLNWKDYKLGFEKLGGEFWFGLERVYQLTRWGNCRLEIDLWDFSNNFLVASYSSFAIESEDNLFTLRVGGYSGNATDILVPSGGGEHNNQPFTTPDRDNDNWSGNCSKDNHGRAGGWWFNACQSAQLNAQWGRDTPYFHWAGSSKMKSTMKFRCE
ncbi:angiopoietin-related protein 6-like [Clavelina lepadiformis]|uniref:angiopoietin-related protein 6-like n=1 Tax=Clavelina lepadiformis TaxID=159417 RepID=UPI004042598C